MGGLQSDPHRLIDRAVEERDPLGGTSVLRVVGEHEDRALPRSAVGSEVTDDAVEAVAPREDGAGGVDVLLVQPSRTVVLSMKSMVCPGPATKLSRDIRKWKSTFPAAVCGSGSPMIASSLSGRESNVSR